MAWPGGRCLTLGAGNDCDAFLSAMDGTRSHWGTFSKQRPANAVKRNTASASIALTESPRDLACSGWRLSAIQHKCHGSDQIYATGIGSWRSTEFHLARLSVPCSMAGVMMKAGIAKGVKGADDSGTGLSLVTACSLFSPFRPFQIGQFPLIPFPWIVALGPFAAGLPVTEAIPGCGITPRKRCRHGTSKPGEGRWDSHTRKPA